MADAVILLALVAVGIMGGSIAGMGGPGGIPVLLALNLLLVLPAPVSAATASAIFIVATLVTTGLYQYSDGIDVPLAATAGLPAVVGTYLGTWLADGLSTAHFELILAGVFVLVALGIVYQQRRDSRPRVDGGQPRDGRRRFAVVGILCLWVGVASGITGIGGPGIIVPLLIFLGFAPIRTIGAGVAAGVLITTNATVGHLLQGNAPALLPVFVLGIPYILAQILGWRYVHTVSDRAVAYTIAGLAIAGSVVVVL